MKFSVLMTVYAKEKPEYFAMALKSILVEQTRQPDQFVLVYDGPVSEELKEVTEYYRKVFPNEFVLVELPKNVGQGAASKAGFEKCKYEFIARMDSDDISKQERFEKEITIFENKKDVDVVGSFISEFNNNPDEITGIRQVPETHEDILKMFKMRNPVNNVTVMFKRDSLTKIGGYSEERANEDFNIYVKLLLDGNKFYNIQEPLVHVRTGQGMVERRGDIKIYHAWKKNQKLLYKGNVTNFFEYKRNCIACYCFIRCPKWIKKFLYKFVLRKNNENI